MSYLRSIDQRLGWAYLPFYLIYYIWLCFFNFFQQRMHRDMLVLWLLDIQLSELAEHRQCVTSGSSSNDAFNIESNSGGVPSLEVSAAREAQIRRLRDQLFCFLNRPIVFQAVSDNQTAVYKMIRFVNF